MVVSDFGANLIEVFVRATIDSYLSPREVGITLLLINIYLIENKSSLLEGLKYNLNQKRAFLTIH